MTKFLDGSQDFGRNSIKAHLASKSEKEIIILPIDIMESAKKVLFLFGWSNLKR